MKTATPPLQLDPSFQKGADQGKAANSPFQFTLTIVSEDLDDMTSNPAHQARMVGTVLAPALSPDRSPSPRESSTSLPWTRITLTPITCATG